MAFAAAPHDPVAAAILEEAAEDLATAIIAVATALDLRDAPFPLVMAGGNLRPGLLADALTERIAVSLPQATPIHPALDPALGAALLALHAHRGTAA